MLVTGATGLIGNSLVRLLLERGERVRVLVRPGGDPRPLAGLDVERAQGDLRDPASLERAAAGARVVYHAAGRVVIGMDGLDEARAINVEGTRSVARAARAAGARLVHVSSVDAIGAGTRARPATEATPTRPSSIPYVVSKREAEAAVREEIARGLDAVIVNPALVLGPWDWKPSSGKLLLAIAHGLSRVAPPGGNDFCHAGDVARGIAAAAERGRIGERYILGGEALGYRDAFELIAAVTGGPPPLFTAPAFGVRAAGRAWGGLWRALGRGEPDFNAASAALGCQPHHFDDARARTELGYRSRPARETVEEAWRWLAGKEYDRRPN